MTDKENKNEEIKGGEVKGGVEKMRRRGRRVEVTN